MGKTAFCLNIAEHAALRADERRRRLLARDVEGAARDAHAVLRGARRPGARPHRAPDRPRVPRAGGGGARPRPTPRSTSTTRRPSRCSSCARRRAACSATRQPKLGLIVVDYLQLMRSSEGKDSREQEISEISRSLKALAKELNVPVDGALAAQPAGREPRPRRSRGWPTCANPARSSRTPTSSCSSTARRCTSRTPTSRASPRSSSPSSATGRLGGVRRRVSGCRRTAAPEHAAHPLVHMLRGEARARERNGPPSRDIVPAGTCIPRSSAREWRSSLHLGAIAVDGGSDRAVRRSEARKVGWQLEQRATRRAGAAPAPPVRDRRLRSSRRIRHRGTLRTALAAGSSRAGARRPPRGRHRHARARGRARPRGRRWTSSASTAARDLVPSGIWRRDRHSGGDVSWRYRSPRGWGSRKPPTCEVGRSRFARAAPATRGRLAIGYSATRDQRRVRGTSSSRSGPSGRARSTT